MLDWECGVRIRSWPTLRHCYRVHLEGLVTKWRFDGLGIASNLVEIRTGYHATLLILILLLQQVLPST